MGTRDNLDHSMSFLVVVPARMASSRLPGKPLVDLRGKSLIQRTYEQCLKAVPSEKIMVATDHVEVEEHCKRLGMNVVMTSQDCLTGTDRVAEVARSHKVDHYINVQGDEPLINPVDLLEILKAVVKFPEAVINGYAAVDNGEMYRSLTIPKVVMRPDGRLLYMSRSAIPGNKKGEFRGSWRQICIYAFPAGALRDFSLCKGKTPLEELEDIEVLRFLEMGYEVQMQALSADSVAVDTPADVEKVRTILRNEDE